MRVSVCVATCNRPEGLRRLIEGLDRLEFRKVVPDELGVIVVDNYPGGSGIGVCESMRPMFRWRLDSRTEARRGVSYARNSAVSLAMGNSEFIAFIDDDEVPDPHWLDELLYAQGLYGADVVTGPVVPRFEEEAPAWVTKGRFFERPRHRTGHRLDIARTGNVLISSRLFNDAHLSFGERYALTGGEDTDFFMRAVRAGYTIAWADEAIVHEWVPGSRMTAGWVLRRAYFGGKTYTTCVLGIDRSIMTALVRASKGALRIMQGALSIPPSLVLGRHTGMRALQKICAGAGSIVAVLGECLNKRRAD